MNGHLTIGQVAKTVGIPAKTIRYYEEINLLQPPKRMENKYREYTEEDMVRLRLIKQARALGLSLSEVKQLVQECFDGSCEHLRDRFLTQLPTYISSIKKRIDDLQELLMQLKGLQNNLSTLHLKDPYKRVVEKDCCEVLEKVEMITKKGGVKNGRQKKKS